MKNDTMDEHQFAPESLMMSYGYTPEWSEGAIKIPIFQTSTFVFKKAEDGKAFFEVAYGKRKKAPGEQTGLIYSRINNPDLEILENRLSLWDGSEDAAAFGSGMAAISTVLLEYLQPGQLLLYSTPVYGGTHHFINNTLKRFGIRSLAFRADSTRADIEALLQAHSIAEGELGMIYIETPANPTNSLIDIRMCADLAAHYSTAQQTVRLAVDNTYMGPLWQRPLEHGADFVLYSATKYLGGHSDLIAGAVLGKRDEILRIKAMRTFLGNMCSPQTGWLLLRSLETLKVRMDQQQQNAIQVADFLQNHSKVARVYYLGLLDPQKEAEQHRIYQQQCLGSGAMISFDVRGGEAEAYKVLNHLRLIQLAVSLGSTESLAEHPATMTHTDVPDADKLAMGISDSLIRLSVGVERVDDILADLSQALETI